MIIIHPKTSNKKLQKLENKKNIKSSLQMANKKNIELSNLLQVDENIVSVSGGCLHVIN